MRICGWTLLIVVYGQYAFASFAGIITQFFTLEVTLLSITFVVSGTALICVDRITSKQKAVRSGEE